MLLFLVPGVNIKDRFTCCPIVINTRETETTNLEAVKIDMDKVCDWGNWIFLPKVLCVHGFSNIEFN